MTTDFSPVADLEALKTGKMLRVKVGDQAILLANVDGEIYAVEDMCSHEDASLYNGALKGRCVECPLHGSHFDLKTGQPQQEPATEAIQTFAVKIDNDKICVQL
ncbi:MAG: non-heme iron oxygenase ferredoxin subunit [Thioalkalispiraceae bacterium]|jgi:3-phenylpropionate/trans-cinnamate dioxygenase ferredoxin subunit